MDRGSWRATIHGIAEVEHDRVTEQALSQLLQDGREHDKISEFYEHGITDTLIYCFLIRNNAM